MSTLVRNSPAKINLTLRVAGARPDGFHEIESLVVRVGLYDTINVRPRNDARFALSCDDPSVPHDESNLALRAARRLAEAAGVRGRGVDIMLQKRIPPGAGLGGGSSNAATTLTLLNKLWQLDLAKQELARLGGEIGADVPLFFHTPLCVVRGRGERVQDLPRSLTAWVVLMLPALHLATRDVYAAWDQMASPAARASIDEVLQHADRAATLMPHLFNDLQAAALSVSPSLGEIIKSLSRLSGGAVCMSGSGSAFFCLFDQRTDADAFCQRVIDELHLRVEVVPLLT